jgi:hypothetical protein
VSRWIAIGVVLSAVWLIGAATFFKIAHGDTGHGWGAAFMVAAIPIPIAWVAALLAFWTARLVRRYITPC